MQRSHPYMKSGFLTELLSPKRISFIVNPKAGTNLQKHIRESVEKYLNHDQFEYGFKYTEHAGHARELALEALAEGYDIVTAVGGDGSINEVASALIGTKAILGIIPAGSGNGLAMHLGYGRDVEGAVRKLNTAQEKIIDVGLMNGRPFINLAGIGFDGLVSNMMKGSNWRGFIPYFLKSVEAGLKYTPSLCTIEMDDRVLTEKCFAITIANGPMYGYNFQIAPDARMDDGLFEVVILKDAPRWQYFAAVPATLIGKIYDAGFVEHFTTKRVRISTEGTNYTHLDGEGLVQEGDLTFEMKPKSLHILVPQQKSDWNI
ncbi:MAG: diacylglycerol kinase family lipid kinase [Lewinellaceae bacterium]|mgnify:CR=1 FL=1|nr:diacylglycerol kinase family lipid kinase [Lewinellaceae bacterium]